MSIQFDMDRIYTILVKMNMENNISYELVFLF